VRLIGGNTSAVARRSFTYGKCETTEAGK
jgi:hypothetical protein